MPKDLCRETSVCSAIANHNNTRITATNEYKNINKNSIINNKIQYTKITTYNQQDISIDNKKKIMKPVWLV